MEGEWYNFEISCKSKNDLKYVILLKLVSN